jgi:hypothetical protein
MRAQLKTMQRDVASNEPAEITALSGRSAFELNARSNQSTLFAGLRTFGRVRRRAWPLTRNARMSTSPRKRAGEVKERRLVSRAADDELLSFFTATFAPVKFERSPERLAETLLR